MLFESKQELAAMIRKRPKTETFQWREGSHFKGKADANEVGKHVESIAKDNGGVITTDMVVMDSDNPKSPIYSLVTRDIEEAAMKQRKHECRQIVNSLTVVRIQVDKDTGNEEPTAIRAFLHTNKEQGYVPLYAAVSRPDIAEEYHQKLIDEAQRFAQRAKEISIFSSVVNAIEQLPKQA